MGILIIFAFLLVCFAGVFTACLYIHGKEEARIEKNQKSGVDLSRTFE